MTIIKKLENIGFPILNFHSGLKENVFLNTSDTNARGCEAIGNFLITPARYFLNGKEITKIDGVNTDCSFTFANKHRSFPVRMLQNIVAIITLVPGVILGSAFKGLSYLSGSIREKQREIKRCLYSTEGLEAKITTLHKQIGIDPLTTNETPYNNPNPVPRPDPKIHAEMKNHMIEAQRLGEIGDVLSAAGIPWWVDNGTLLGVYRHNGFIPWDEDIDVSIPSEYFDVVKRLLIEKLPKDKFQVWDFSPASCPNSLLKLCLKETNMLMDIYTYTQEEIDGKKQLKYEFAMINEWWIPHSIKNRERTTLDPIDHFFPLKNATFDGHTVRIPNKLENHLIVQYSEAYSNQEKTCEEQLKDLEPCKVWSSKKQDYVPVQGHNYNI